MTGLFYLIRHASHDWLGKGIAGRQPGVHLNAQGGQEAQCLADRLSRENIRWIFSSPLERALETAEPLAKRSGINVQVLERLNELDFGEWTGRSIDELNQDPVWSQWNQFRSGGRIRDGESMAEAQYRVVTEIERLRREFPQERIALFSHGDPIRAALLYYLGMPLDFVHRLEISPASWSVLSVNAWGAQVLGLNLRV